MDWNPTFMADLNRRIIEEFRASRGHPPSAGGAPTLLLHHFGARSGIERVIPLTYLADANRFVVFASKAGAPTNPAWFHNLVAHPLVAIEVADTTRDAIASVVSGEERVRLWTRQKRAFPSYSDYEAKTSREIPVVALEPVAREVA